MPTDADIHEPTSYAEDALLRPESRAAYRRLLKRGWTDSIRERNPDKTVHTFWDNCYRRWERNAGLRIGHILLSPSIAPQLASAGVDLWACSEPNPGDHAPAWVKLAPEAKAKARRAAAKTQARKRPPTRK